MSTQLPDFDRIRPVIDVDQLAHAEVAVIGLGGVGISSDLARCGVGSFVLCDDDKVSPTNVARQDYMTANIGRAKVDAVHALLHQINPRVQVVKCSSNFCSLTDDESDRLFRSTDLFCFTTDSFHAQARGNRIALRMRRPAVWVGLYEGGQAGEVVWRAPDSQSCYRCLCSKRYEAFDRAVKPRQITSRGASIFDLRLPDAIAGMIAVGLLTRGADNRFGRLIEQLGDRQFLQIKIDPEFTWNGRDIFAEQLSIPEHCDAYFSFVTIARSDPDRGRKPCPDCDPCRPIAFSRNELNARAVA